MDKKTRKSRKSLTREKIINLLKEKKTALTHKEFQDFFNNEVDRVTIYRALDFLVEEGKLHKVVNLEGGIQYALCQTCTHEKETHSHNHVHFSCLKCNKTTCLENVTPEIKLPKNFETTDIQILISGICDKCNE
ncbi:conserved hypothetical protein [Flavobacterium sp. 9AF]|uniref:Fur family transcriptional regulator n=1 Tax=Flavobacterium sp. 9AF TaxID=2653142 RepID=UPI0012EF1F9A|nr:transcriptional repressor [Flavobacterium sp. 9AF]VXB46696.1 conserved hypothetical protein [Flavobacterium sp. 9AF]